MDETKKQWHEGVPNVIGPVCCHRIKKLDESLLPCLPSSLYDGLFSPRSDGSGDLHFYQTGKGFANRKPLVSVEIKLLTSVAYGFINAVMDQLVDLCRDSEE